MGTLINCKFQSFFLLFICTLLLLVSASFLYRLMTLPVGYFPLAHLSFARFPSDTFPVPVSQGAVVPRPLDLLIFPRH